jgi:SAM-dependent methyltransferase
MYKGEMKKKLHIGCGNDYMEDSVNLDLSFNVKADVHFDLESCSTASLPFEDDTFEEIFAAHTLEHIDNILPAMQELHRVAKDKCIFIIRVPYGATNSAFDDPTHVRQLFPSSFLYFGQPAYHRADYGYRGDWSVQEIGLTIHPNTKSSLDKAGIPIQFAVHHMHNVVHEQLVALQAIKPIRPRDVTRQETITPSITLITDAVKN